MTVLYILAHTQLSDDTTVSREYEGYICCCSASWFVGIAGCGTCAGSIVQTNKSSLFGHNTKERDY